jgi:phosphoribosylanthranilate isomerase
MVFIKICGITNLEDALDAVEAGADGLGFNFFPPSPRYIEPAVARTIIDRLPATVQTFGVFVNESSPETVKELAAQAGVSALQLHGDEDPEFCDHLRDRYIVKVLALGSDFDSNEALRYEVDAFMVDAVDRKAWGGTGRTVDWSVARSLRERVPRLFLAGGLSPQNVAEAISTVEPYAVDACSLLETSPGKKDRARLREFVRAARAVKP